MRFSRCLSLLATLAAAAAGACGPCGGTVACATDYRLRVSGFIVDHETGAPVRNARVDVTFIGAGDPQTRTTTTDENGQWDASAEGNCCGQFYARASVAPPGRQPYLVPDFPIRSVNRLGDAVLVGEWADRPFVRFAGTLLLRGVEPLSDATARFEAVTGIPADPPQRDASADAIGNFEMRFTSDRIGSVIGTLIVTHPSLPAPKRIEGFSIPIDKDFRLRPPVPVFVNDLP